MVTFVSSCGERFYLFLCFVSNFFHSLQLLLGFLVLETPSPPEILSSPAGVVAASPVLKLNIFVVGFAITQRRARLKMVLGA